MEKLNYAQILRFHFLEIVELKEKGKRWESIADELKKRYGFAVNVAYMKRIVNTLIKDGYIGYQSMLIVATRQGDGSSICSVGSSVNSIDVEERGQVKPADNDLKIKLERVRDILKTKYRIAVNNIGDDIVSRIAEKDFNDQAIWIENNLLPAVRKNAGKHITLENI